MLPHYGDARVNVDAGNRIALLRHRRGRTAAVGERLEHLLDLGLHHQLDVEGDFSQRAADEAEEAADLGDAVAHRVPGDLGLAQAKLRHQRRLHAQSVRAERGERAAGAGELAYQRTRPQFVQALQMTLKTSQPYRALEPEA